MAKLCFSRSQKHKKFNEMSRLDRSMGRNNKFQRSDASNWRRQIWKYSGDRFIVSYVKAFSFRKFRSKWRHSLLWKPKSSNFHSCSFTCQVKDTFPVQYFKILNDQKVNMDRIHSIINYIWLNWERTFWEVDYLSNAESSH